MSKRTTQPTLRRSRVASPETIFEARRMAAIEKDARKLGKEVAKFDRFATALLALNPDNGRNNSSAATSPVILLKRQRSPEGSSYLAARLSPMFDGGGGFSDERVESTWIGYKIEFFRVKALPPSEIDYFSQEPRGYVADLVGKGVNQKRYFVGKPHDSLDDEPWVMRIKNYGAGTTDLWNAEHWTRTLALYGESYREASIRSHDRHEQMNETATVLVEALSNDRLNPHAGLILPPVLTKPPLSMRLG